MVAKKDGELGNPNAEFYPYGINAQIQGNYR